MEKSNKIKCTVLLIMFFMHLFNVTYFVVYGTYLKRVNHSYEKSMEILSCDK